MLDINLIREEPGKVRKNLARRKEEDVLNNFDKLLKVDEEWRDLKKKVDDLRHDRNKYSEKVNELMKDDKKEEAQEYIEKSRKVGEELEKAEKDMEGLKQERDELLLRIPNLMHESVPYGEDDSENEEVRKWGETPKFDFEIRNHAELAEELGVADFDKASEISGAGFEYLKGDLARLNLALCMYGVDFMQDKGFQLVIPPMMMRREPYEGVTDLADFENVMYKIEDEDSYLIATSEHPIASMYKDGVLKGDDLPVKLVGFSPCFRKEIGSHGIDTKGLFRTHQFWKVEQFIFSHPDDSWDYHEELINYSEEIFRNLKLPHRVVNICTGDLGIVASKKYDLEVWMPRQDKYREEGSCSNCTDYQARRLNVKFDSEGERKLVHTLNNTAIATSRAMVAILENNQQRDGSVIIPKVLRKYMNGQKKIEPK